MEHRLLSHEVHQGHGQGAAPGSGQHLYQYRMRDKGSESSTAEKDLEGGGG